MHVTKIGPGIGLEAHKLLMSFLTSFVAQQLRFYNCIGLLLYGELLFDGDSYYIIK